MKTATVNVPFITSFIFTFLLHSYTLFFLLSATITVERAENKNIHSENEREDDKDLHLMPALHAPLVVRSGGDNSNQQSDTQEKLELNTQKEFSDQAANTLSESSSTASIFFLKEETEKSEQPAQESLPSEAKSTSALQKRALTLADLFRTLPHLTGERTEQGVDGKETLIITQGDMKYYSFLKDFIQHMNNTFNFDDGPQKMEEWMRKKLLIRNTALSIVIDKQGAVQSVKVTASSGFEPFDELAVATVYKASPFAPVPDHFKQDMVRVELTSTL